MRLIKLFLIILVISFNLIGCTNKNMYLSLENKSDVELIKNRLQDNIISVYKVNNIPPGKYFTSIYIESYELGELKETIDILTNQIDIINNKDNFYIGINKNNESLRFDISINNQKNNLALTSNDFMIKEPKDNKYTYLKLNDNINMNSITLNKSIPIASLSLGINGEHYLNYVGSQSKNPSTLNSNKEIPNSKDLIVYLKINKI